MPELYWERGGLLTALRKQVEHKLSKQYPPMRWEDTASERKVLQQILDRLTPGQARIGSGKGAVKITGKELRDIANQTVETNDDLYDLMLGLKYMEIRDHGSAPHLVYNDLIEEGYDSITHIGGGRTGTAPHNVWIDIDPDKGRTIPWDVVEGEPTERLVPPVRGGSGTIPPQGTGGVLPSGRRPAYKTDFVNPERVRDNHLTGWFGENVQVDLDDLKTLPGYKGEHTGMGSEYSQEHIKNLSENMKKEGWSGGSVMIFVERDGSVAIGEGNHRVQAALNAGITEIPAEIKYFGNSNQDPNVWGRKYIDRYSSQ
jgi:hypothetical protein